MSDSLAICSDQPLPLLSLFLFLISSTSLAFDDHPSSLCSLSPEFSAFFSPIPRAHQLCTCESDWADAFCARLSAYERMAPEKAPSVCICRQTFGGFGGCVQFLTRCFRRPLHGSQGATHQHVQQHRLRREQCACCFNQPDPFCTQLDCAQMRPQFDASANTSCHCYLPKIGNVPYAPSALCRQQSQLFTREIAPQWNSAAEQNLRHKSDQPSASAPAGSSFRPSFGTFFPSVSSPLIRFCALLLLALVIVSLTAIAICFLNNWKRIRLRRTEEKEGKETKQQQRKRESSRRTMGNGLLEEATV